MKSLQPFADTLFSESFLLAIPASDSVEMQEMKEAVLIDFDDKVKDDVVPEWTTEGGLRHGYHGGLLVPSESRSQDSVTQLTRFELSTEA
jgi:hypothetical protein